MVFTRDVSSCTDLLKTGKFQQKERRQLSAFSSFILIPLFTFIILKTAYSFSFHLTQVPQHLHILLQYSTVELPQKICLGKGRGEQGKALGKQYKTVQLIFKKEMYILKIWDEIKCNSEEGKNMVGILNPPPSAGRKGLKCTPHSQNPS